MPVVDTPGYLKVRAGDGSLPNVNVSVDGQGGLTPQHVIRLADGSQVGVVPMPTADAVGNAALGTPADIAWASGSGTLVSLLKALVAAVSGGSAGGATAAKQDTGNTALATIATNTTGGPTAAGQGNALTQATAAAAALGAPADAAWAGTGSSSIVGALKALWTALTGTLAVKQAGSVGLDRSANAPAGPGAATSFVFNGTTLNLLATIAANPARRGLEVNNTTGALAVVVLDDGANTAGSVSLFPLAAGAGAFQQGADFSPPNELGRLRIFGTTGTYCYARET